MIVLYMYLHIWRVEVNLAELEYHNIIPVLADRYVVPEGAVVIAFGLIQNLVHGVDTSYDQLLAVIGRGADSPHQRILGVAYPVAVDVSVTARVDGVDHLQAVRPESEHGEQHQQCRQDIVVPRWQSHSLQRTMCHSRHDETRLVPRGEQRAHNSFLRNQQVFFLYQRFSRCVFTCPDSPGITFEFLITLTTSIYTSCCKRTHMACGYAALRVRYGRACGKICCIYSYVMLRCGIV